MIAVRIGDIFESKAQTLVNTVNCVGVMGKGIALEFRKRFPDMYNDYVQRCKARQVKLGQPYLYERLAPPWILNFPTKDHWRSVSRLEDIIAGLHYLQDHCREWGIMSLGVPPLGCGQGQLEWRVVGPTLYRHLKGLDIAVELFAPFGTPHEELRPTFLDDDRAEPLMPSSETRFRVAPAWIALVEVLRGIEREPYHWPVGRITFQKIAYFATESGIPTGLRYRRGSFGPYADQIKQWRGLIDKIIDLFVRMNTEQAEIAATVHFAAVELKRVERGRPSEVDILNRVMDWKQCRRPRLDDKEVALTIRNLNMLSWIGAEVSGNLPVAEEEVLGV